jgi:hypothetical protein
VVYVLTLYPDLAGGDSGELTTAVATGGVIHPPGYPLYALLGKLFVHLPHASVAWRMSFLSAACDATAAGVLCAAVARWSGSRAAGIVSGALFASAPGVWRYAICAEVFALNNLLVTIMLLLAVLYAQGRQRKHAMAGALVAGLGMSNHQTFVFTAAPVVVWALWIGRKELLQPRVVARLVLFFALGLLPYLYLPIAASHHAPVTWGAADTWQGFWTHVLRREYGTFQLAPSGIAGAPDSGETVGAWARDLVEQIGWWGLPLALAGAVASLRASRETRLGAVAIAVPLLAVGVMAVLGNLPVRDALHRGIVARFWQQPDVFFFAWCGFGVAWLEPRLPRWGVWTLAGGLAVLPAALRFHTMDRHTSTLVRSYGAEILRAAPPGALLVTKGDLITSSIRYLQAIEATRPDVRLVDQELLGDAWYRPLVLGAHPEILIPGPRYMPGAPDSFTMKELFDDNIGSCPILVCGGIKPGDATADATYGRWPFGLCEEVHPGSAPVNLDAWIRESEDALPHIDFTGQQHPPGSWEDIVWSDYWEVRVSRAAHLLLVAGADPSRRQYIGVAADMLQKVVDGNPDVGAHVYKDLAIAIGRGGLDSPEARARAAAAWRKYLELAPPDDPQLPAIKKELERLTR